MSAVVEALGDLALAELAIADHRVDEEAEPAGVALGDHQQAPERLAPGDGGEILVWLQGMPPADVGTKTVHHEPPPRRRSSFPFGDPLGWLR